MFARVFTLLPLALLASATHLAARTQENSCNSSGGTEACCSQGFNQNLPAGSAGNVVNLILNAAVAAGVSCTGIAVTTCSQQNLCCYKSNSEGGLVNISCNNINGA